MDPDKELVNDIYYQKYLKYKAKYLELKNQIAGGPAVCKPVCPKHSSGKHYFEDGKPKGHTGFWVCSHCKCGKKKPVK